MGWVETDFVDWASVQTDSEERFFTDVPGWIKTQRLDEGGAGPTWLRSRFLVRHLVVKPAPAEYWVDLRVEVAHDQGRRAVHTFGGVVGPSDKKMHPEGRAGGPSAPRPSTTSAGHHTEALVAG